MAKIEDVSVEELEGALEVVEGKRAVQRLMIAILYKRGPSVPTIAEWYGVRERTIYDWLDRLEDRPIADAVTDDHRSGRPPKLADSDRERFEDAVTRSPAESGYEQPAWSTALARQFLREEFDVEYSRRHVQRLLNDAGLSHRTSPPESPTADDGERGTAWTPVTGESPN